MDDFIGILIIVSIVAFMQSLLTIIIYSIVDEFTEYNLKHEFDFVVAYELVFAISAATLAVILYATTVTFNMGGVEMVLMISVIVFVISLTGLSISLNKNKRSVARFFRRLTDISYYTIVISVVFLMVRVTFMGVAEVLLKWQ